MSDWIKGSSVRRLTSSKIQINQWYFNNEIFYKTMQYLDYQRLRRKSNYAFIKSGREESPFLKKKLKSTEYLYIIFLGNEESIFELMW